MENEREVMENERDVERMLTLAEESRKFIYFEGLSLGGGVTIDSSNNDNGYLACARTGWTNPPADSTYVQAASNLRNYGFKHVLNLDKLVLVGHGNAGLISTGDGLSPSTSQGYIAAGTYGAWAPSFGQLFNHGSLLTLCGCDCGAEAAGATFLYQLATLINRPVRGRTGLVFLSCPGAYISYENGSVWQVAQPGIMPTPIPKPFVRSSGNEQDIEIDGIAAFSSEAIFQVELQFPNGSKNTVESANAQSLAREGNLSRPARIQGAIGAVLTGRVILSADVRGKRFDRSFDMYNDRVLQDTAARTNYYFCSQAFTEEVRNVRTRK
jgi:hypothetical protein